MISKSLKFSLKASLKLPVKLPAKLSVLALLALSIHGAQATESGRRSSGVRNGLIGSLGVGIGYDDSDRFTSNSVDLLIRLEAGYSQRPGTNPQANPANPYWDPSQKDRFIWAHLKGDLLIDTQAEGGDAVRFVKTSLTFLHNEIAILADDGVLKSQDWGLFQFNGTRDLALNERGGFRVQTLFVKLGKKIPIGPAGNSQLVSAILEGGLGILGYQAKWLSSNLGSLHAAHIVEASGLTGIAINPTPNVEIRFLVQGRATVDWGTLYRPDANMVGHSELELTGAMEIDFQKAVSIFIKSGGRFTCIYDLDEQSCSGDPFLMAGFRVNY